MPTLKNVSIGGQIKQSMRLLLAVLAVPAIISMVMMLAYSSRYHESISRMEKIASTKPLVGTEIAEQVWSVVAGRETTEECRAYLTIQQVNETLEALMLESTPESQLELIMARRTMDTLSQYVKQIEDNMTTGVPIVESEATLEEVRDVATLAERMLEDYIIGETQRASKTNTTLRRVVAFSAMAEVLLLLLALVVATVAYRRTEQYVCAPIERLEGFAKRLAAGDLSARIPPANVAELEEVTRQVNIMADRLASLMKQNRREQENLKKAELRTLQAQINPHFLYNTLDAIIWKAEADRLSEVIEITRALSDFFRISLSSGADWIPVSQELKHIAGYLSIQKTRYRDILNYEIAVEGDMEGVYILKLLLQPLVENALYHGIKNKRGGGIIRVMGRREGDFLCFSVQDTGNGMKPEQLQAILDHMRSDKLNLYATETGGFGLSNVDQRIRLYYQQPEGLRIQSGAEGTTVSLRVPCKSKEDIANDEGVRGR